MAARMTAVSQKQRGQRFCPDDRQDTICYALAATRGAGRGQQPRQCAMTARNRRVSMTDLARASKVSACSGLDSSAIRSLVMAISLPRRARPATGVHACRCPSRGASRGGDERMGREASTGEGAVHRLARRLRAPEMQGCL
jgi:hypothetical protein